MGVVKHRLDVQGCPQVQAGGHIVPEAQVGTGHCVVTHRLRGGGNNIEG